MDTIGGGIERVGQGVEIQGNADGKFDYSFRQCACVPKYWFYLRCGIVQSRNGEMRVSS